MLKWDHLGKLGIKQKWLDVNHDRLAAMVADMPQKTKEEISLLKGQLDELYAHVNLEVSYIAFTVEAVLMTLLCRVIMDHG